MQGRSRLFSLGIVAMAGCVAGVTGGCADDVTMAQAVKEKQETAAEKEGFAPEQLAKLRDQQKIEIRISDTGTIFWLEEVTVTQLRLRLGEYQKINPEGEIIIVPSAKTVFKVVLHVLDLVKEAGFQNIRFES